jgi:hypothetical protein
MDLTLCLRALQNNVLVGTIPSTIGLLTQLKSLALAQNDFTGTIPSELGLLSELNGL